MIGFHDKDTADQDSKIPGFRDSGIPGFQDFGIPGFRDSRISGFQDSGIPGFRDSIVWGLTGAPPGYLRRSFAGSYTGPGFLHSSF